MQNPYQSLTNVMSSTIIEVSMRRAPKPVVAKRVQDDDSGVSNAAISLLRQGIEQSEVHVNLGQQMIITTEDRLRLCLKEMSESTKHRWEWQVPAGILVTELATCVTSSFHDAIGVSGQQWEGVFRALTFVTALWLLVALLRALRPASADALVNKLKTGRQRSIVDEAGPS
jgi:hypothetical protein